jgi:hypothetical protein
MKRFTAIIFALSCALTAGAVTVTPIVQPHVTFVDASGNPCAGCSLYSYNAGTTTPLATYADSTGVAENTNPIILDAAGGAQIWFGGNSYKLILKDATGVTIWSVDNVNASSLLPCGPWKSIQFANEAVNGLDCDAQIYINKVAHTLNVGTLTPAHVTIGALSTPTTWTLDTTSPATALASMNGVADGAGTTTPNLVALSTATAHQLQYSSALPNGTTATTQAASDNSTKVATTAYVATPGAIAPTSVAVNAGAAMTDNQGTGAKVQHSTGTTTTGHLASFDASGNVVDSGGTAPIARTCNANGCYRIESDGTIEAWGHSAATGATGSAYTLAVTFPTAFTTTTNLELVATAHSDATGDGNPHPATCHVVGASVSTSGASVIISLPTQIGGSGYANLAASDYCTWHALGY